MRYTVKVDGPLGKGVLVTEHYFEAMKEISAALRNGHTVTARREGGEATRTQGNPRPREKGSHSQ